MKIWTVTEQLNDGTVIPWGSTFKTRKQAMDSVYQQEADNHAEIRGEDDDPVLRALTWEHSVTEHMDTQSALNEYRTMFRETLYIVQETELED